MHDIFIRQYFPFTIFESFLGWLISSDVELSSYLWYIINILRGIDPYFPSYLSLRGTKQSIVTRSIKHYLLHLIISSDRIGRDKCVTLRMFHEVSESQFMTFLHQLSEHLLILRKRYSREVNLEKLLVGFTIGRTMKYCIDIVKNIFRSDSASPISLSLRGTKQSIR